MYDVRAIRREEIEQSIPLLVEDATLASAGMRSSVEAFLDLAKRERYDLTRQMVAVRDGRLRYTCLFIPASGRTAFVYSSRCSAEDEALTAAAEALRRLRDWAFASDCYLVQVLIEPADEARFSLLQQAGFKHLTDLSYLMSTSVYTFEESADGEDYAWLGYSEQNEPLFKEVIQRTYQQSLDCPELQYLREMDDVLASHKSAGEFEPGLWKLLMVEQRPVGVLLLAPMKSGGPMELVYMGLTPEARGKGLGNVLLFEALRATARYGCESMVLAVDVRNRPAFGLYEKMGFREVLQRRVMYCSEKCYTQRV